MGARCEKRETGMCFFVLCVTRCQCGWSGQERDGKRDHNGGRTTCGFVAKSSTCSVEVRERVTHRKASEYSLEGVSENTNSLKEWKSGKRDLVEMKGWKAIGETSWKIR